MASFYDEFLELLHGHHQGAIRALRDVPSEALDWNSRRRRNSLTALAVHTAGSERYWMKTVIGNDPEPRDRDAEFSARNQSAETLIQGLEQAEAVSARILAGLTPDSLGETREIKRPKKTHTFTVGWILLHVLEHVAYHTGQMQSLSAAWRDEHEDH